jgi:drug/metabolite transporter (DMT)-like permease
MLVALGVGGLALVQWSYFFAIHRVVAWAWLGESLDLTQLSGAAVTLAGISLAQTSR